MFKDIEAKMPELKEAFPSDVLPHVYGITGALLVLPDDLSPAASLMLSDQRGTLNVSGNITGDSLDDMRFGLTGRYRTQGSTVLEIELESQGQTRNGLWRLTNSLSGLFVEERAAVAIAEHESPAVDEKRCVRLHAGSQYGSEWVAKCSPLTLYEGQIGLPPVPGNMWGIAGTYQVSDSYRAVFTGTHFAPTPTIFGKLSLRVGAGGA